MEKNKLQNLISIIIVVFFVDRIIFNLKFIIDYTSVSGIDFRYLWFNIIIFIVIGLGLVLSAIYALKTSNDSIQTGLFYAFILLGTLFNLISSYDFISIYDLILVSIVIFEKTIMKESKYNTVKQSEYKIKESVIPNNESVNSVIKTETNINVVNDENSPIVGEKEILKTKIINTHQRESSSSKKKGKLLSAIATGLMAGAGGSSSDIMAAQRTQNGYNNRNATFETVVTFLVIYTDNTRETVETVQGDCNYNKYIMYIG